MELKQYAAEHIIENGKHYPEKWVNRYFIEVADAQRALDAEREKVKGLKKRLAEEHPGLDEVCDERDALQAQLADRDAMILQMGEQAAVLAKENMAVKAQLRQVEGQSQQQAEEAVIVFAKYTTLQQLLEDVLHTFGYLRFHRVAGMDGLLYETHNKMSPERTVEACEKRIRATLLSAAGKQMEVK